VTNFKTIRQTKLHINCIENYISSLHKIFAGFNVALSLPMCPLGGATSKLIPSYYRRRHMPNINEN